MYNNGDGCVNPDVFKENASSFYGNTTSAESRPFSENVYDGSPLDRVKAVYGVGQDWFSAGKCAETEFLTNSTDVPTLKCLNLKVEEYSDTSFTVKKAGFYPASTLLVTKSMDEDGNTAYSFTDFSGKTLLERRVLSSDKTADTYYVYDDFGDLRAVIPPMLSKEVSTSTSTHWTSDSEPFGRWAFLYVYDSRHRCVAKKMPGAGWNLTLYDKAGNAILTQDARQREQNEWAFNIPDALGRVCLQGLCEESSLFGNDTGIDVFSGPFQNVAVRAFRSQGSLAATSAFYGYSIDGMVIDSTTTFLTVNYYDDHSFVGMYGFPQDLLFDEALVDNGYGNRWSSAHNLLTGSMSAVITSEGVSTGKFRHTALFYDEYGRVVQTISRYEDGGRIRTASAFDFAGNQTLSREVVSMSDACDTVERIDTYDLWGRIKRTTTSLSDGSGLNASSTVGYTYDNVGRLVGVTYGTGANAVNESLAYNVRSWLTEKRSDVFGMRLRYNTPALGSAPCWNGGVSEWEWGFGTEAPQAYSFSYDALGRLTDSRRFIGTSGSPTDSFSERDLSYDLNGNILTLNRFGESSLLPEDALTFSYSGNRINSVSGSPSFGYDSNGNMTADGRLGLNLSYNHLNLVSEVGDASGTLAYYTYISDGTKISAEKPDGSGTVYRGSLVYSKDGNGNLSLDCVLTDGGRIAAARDASGTVTAYHALHHLTDHLGSVRAVVDGDTGSVIETNDYYPFGKRIQATGPVAEPVEATSPNRWLFSGKEDQSFLSAGIPLLDFGARMYNPTIARWTAADPLSENYYSISPYAYCIGNPVIFIDPNGESTWVTRGKNGTFIVTDKGNPFDNDSNIYVTYEDDNGVWQRGESIGQTVSPYSFYNFDAKNGGAWAVDSVINTEDNSGSDFLQMFYDEWQPELIDYMANARNGHKYDFKVSNGEPTSAYGSKLDPYRGMPIGKGTDGKNIYASARDIGNIAAGYVAGANGIGWISARTAFDGYQILSNILSSSISDIIKTGFRRESLSTRVPEYYGWTRGYLNYNSKRRIHWYLYDK